MGAARVNVREDLPELICDIHSELDAQSIREAFCELVVDTSRFIRTVIEGCRAVSSNRAEFSRELDLLEDCGWRRTRPEQIAQDDNSKCTCQRAPLRTLTRSIDYTKSLMDQCKKKYVRTWHGRPVKGLRIVDDALSSRDPQKQRETVRSKRS